MALGEERVSLNGRLCKLANVLDLKGLTKEADLLDLIILQSMSKYSSKKDNSYFEDEGMNDGNWGTSASGLLVTDGSRVLLLKRSSDVLDPGLWGIPGGAIPRNKRTGVKRDAKESALTEAEEEMGGVPNGSIVGEFVFRKGKDFTYTTFVLKTHPQALDSFTPNLNWEHVGYKLFYIDEVHGNRFHPGVLWVIQQLAR